MSANRLNYGVKSGVHAAENERGKSQALKTTRQENRFVVHVNPSISPTDNPIRLRFQYA